MTFRRLSSFRRSLCVVCLLLALAEASLGYAATINAWHTVTGGSWNSGSNWKNGNVPTAIEDASIGSAASTVSPGTVTLDANQAAYGLTLDPGAGKAIHVDAGAP